MRQLRSKKITSVKVLWRNHPTEEATWESEADIRDRYPHMFDTLGVILNSFEDECHSKCGRI